MVRTLRKRVSRPNYALTGFEEDDNPEAGPSARPETGVDESELSGSDFEPGRGENPRDEDAENPEEHLVTTHEEEPSRPFKKPKVSSGKGGIRSKSKSKKETPVKPPPPPPTPGVPLPNVHHRHRALPIYHRQGKVERLDEEPQLFAPTTVVPTNSWSYPNLTERLGRAHGYNVGPGPLWELMEDRAWYKESFGHDEESESSRRPRAHDDVKDTLGWEILSPENGLRYVPSDSQGASSSLPVTCSFGPFGEQARVTLNTLESVKMSTYFPDSRSHVLNAGAGVWGIDWCPIYPHHREALSFKQYLAVGPLCSKAHAPLVGAKLQKPVCACVQIWTLSPPKSSDESGHGSVHCDLVLCIDGGSALDLKWCPLPSHDSFSGNTEAGQVRKLGILAGVFEDGSVSLYVVPEPDAIRKQGNVSIGGAPVFVKPHHPILRLELEDTACQCLDWANSEIIAVGCANGNIAVYDVATAFRTGQTGMKERVLPTHYFSVHQSAIRCITWVRVPTMSTTGKKTADNPTVIGSGGYDGTECFSDTRECVGIVMNRTRDVVNSMDFSTFYGGPITVDQENTVKAYSLAPSMLGRGHKLLEPSGPVWSVKSCDYHPQIAIGASDGSCLTTNIMRSTRRGGNVAFFVHKIYQLDYSRVSGEYRMLERSLPEETQDRPTATRANRVLPVGTGAWPREVGVQRVVWNSGNGLGGAPLLASATASGLCRVDWLLGRWYRDRVPYTSVEMIRREVDDGGAMEEDSD